MTGSNTREALLDAAERMFAERGIYGVSLGEIGRRANQHNRSAIQYHFGSREALIEAIAARHVGTLNERRVDLLRTLDLTGRGDDVRALVEALILPPFRLLESSGSYFRFLVQWSFRGTPASGFTELTTHPDSNTLTQVVARIDGELGGIDPRVRLFRYRNAFFTVVQVLADCEARIEGGEDLDERFTMTSLVDLVVGIFQAPDHTALSPAIS